MSDVIVPRLMPIFDASAARTRAVGSASRLAQPIAGAINHLLGDTMRGLLCWQPCDTQPANGADMERSLVTYRHPNCDYLHVLLYTGIGKGEGSDAIAVTAGAGTVTTRSLAGVSREWVEIVAPWGASSGWSEVVISGTNVGWQHTLVHEIYRPSLDSATDLCLASFDSTYPIGGLREGRKIIQSDESGLRGAIVRDRDAWGYGLRQHISWWPVGDDLYVDSTDWTNPLPGSQTFHVRARQGWGEPSRGARAYVWTYGAATVDEYQVRVLNGGGTGAASDILTNTTGSWNDPLLGTGGAGYGFAVSADDDDELTLQLKRVSGTGRVYVQRFSVIEEYGWSEWPLS